MLQANMIPAGTTRSGRREHNTRIAAAFALVTAVLASAVHAHEIRPAVVNLTFDDAGGYRIELAVNVEGMLAGVSPQHRDTDESPNAKRYAELRALAPERLQPRVAASVPALLAGMRLEFDGARAAPRFAGADIPPVGDLALARVTRLTFEGDVPEGARTFRWSYLAELGPNVLRVRRARDTELTAVWLAQGAASDVFALAGPIAQSRLEVAWQYVVLGFTHILPKGLDHILFVLGLFLLSRRLQPLLVQVTAFTAAHSITLGLTIYGVFSLSPAIVEPLIAASIVYVALENVLTSRLHVWRPFIVFGFGLLHGMGFAGVLQELGLPRSEFLTALVTFNVGVELGQLAVIALACAAVAAWARDPARYRGRVVVPASVAIAAVGLYWTVERVIG